LIGSYQANIDPNYPNQRAFSATIPKDYFESVRNANITQLQLNAIDQNIASNLEKIRHHNHSSPNSVDLSSESLLVVSSPRQSQSNYNTSASDSFGSTITNTNTDSDQSFNMMLNRLQKNSHDNKPSLMMMSPTSGGGGSECGAAGSSAFDLDTNLNIDENESMIEIIERQQQTNTSNKKNVSFNKDIDVRVFRKNSKNSRLLESFMLPLPSQQEKYQHQLQPQQQQPPKGHDNYNHTNSNGMGSFII
jgi:hypothetical protein